MENYKKFYNVHMKSKLDFFLALVFLIVLLPVYIIISLAIIIDSGFPVFYKADRGGYKGVPFKRFKFRSMV